ncbi:MAG: hypothetical protein K6E95_08125 [Lachnospiraceae bacterium]|nr:hypothetical protein [Lachnospiraceae bacterium]
MRKVSPAEKLYNSILSSYNVPGAYERWRDYRKSVTDRIIEFAEPGKSIAIVGAGEMNDIDIARIYEHSGKVALFDIDVDAMKRGLENYGFENERPDASEWKSDEGRKTSASAGKQDESRKCGITVKKCDLFGITKDEYTDLINKCFAEAVKVNKKPDNLLLAKYMKEIIGIVNKRRVHISDEKFDCTVAVGLHSQVVGFLAHIWEYLAIIGGIIDNNVFESLINLNNTQIPKINDALIGITRERLFVGYEMYNASFGPESTVQGAVQCNHDLNDRIKNSELTLEISFTEDWAFSDEKQYKMLFYEMKV